MEWVAIGSISAVIVSFFSIFYTWKQNRRRIDVSIEYNSEKCGITEDYFDIDIIAFNSG